MKEHVLLLAEDRHRMTRLYEEVLTRLEEMAMITARTLGMKAETVGDVRFTPLSTGNTVEFKAVEVVRGPHTSGCYDYGQAVCFEYNPRGDRPELSVIREEKPYAK